MHLFTTNNLHKRLHFIATKVLFGLIVLLPCCQVKDTANTLEFENLTYPQKTIQLEAEKAQKLAQTIREGVAVTLADDFELSLWASDTLVQDPIAISIDEKGRVFFTRASRQANSEFDIRGHRNWITASISFESVEDRREFLRETFSKDSEAAEQFLKDLNKDGVRDWRDLTVEKEQIWHIADTDGDGVGDKAQLFLEDFSEEVTDVANGIEVYRGDVFVTAAPDMWRTQDTNDDGVADAKESISHGYAVHIGFGGHGLSGAKIGPDGRIWWAIGDIGMNVTDKSGKNWKYPNQGVIVRSELDGSGFEVYAAGLRNTHEFTFDQYGNLISEDNDGDHSGERERLVYLINGSDCGWRTNWQFGKYTDPENNAYKVWMDERMSVPRWEGQAAYILPPITNYINGPTGLVFNPGTALSEKWYNYFFIAEFRGSPANSPIHAFTLKPKGASFELDKTQIIAKGLLPTGIDFGPDGALYLADWIDGWDPNEQGRIWKLDISGAQNNAIRQETKTLIQSDFSTFGTEELSRYLGHQDMRVRQKAQFELVSREGIARDVFLKVAAKKTSQLARIHSIWGIGQLARKKASLINVLLPFLKDEDPEIVTQSAKMLGDVRYKDAVNELIAQLNHLSLRVQLHVTEALGRIGDPKAFEGITQMLINNDDKDTWLRHAGMIALSRLHQEEALIKLHTHPSRALRVAALVALRRLKSPGTAMFLQDSDPYIVQEAARAINDDLSIEAALPALANVLKEKRFTREALLRRAINANLRVGKPENIENLLNFIQRSAAPAAMRAEALAALSTWEELSVFDRVDGRYHGVVKRDPTPVKNAIKPILANLLQEKNPEIQVATAKIIAKFTLSTSAKPLLAVFQTSTQSEVRKACLNALYTIKDPSLSTVLDKALGDESVEVRAAALAILPKSDLPEDQTVRLFTKILNTASIQEQQSVYASLANMKGDASVKLLSQSLDKLKQGMLSPEVHLDLMEAVEIQENAALTATLDAFQKSKPKDDPLALYRETLLGGDANQGRRVFYRNEAAQCVRCHAIFEYGGNAGPGLAGVGTRLSSEKLLESLVVPSATYALGYEVIRLKLKDDQQETGVVMAENDTEIRLRKGKSDLVVIQKDRIEERITVPSAMPAMGNVLSKRQIRDVIAFLKTLSQEEI